MHSSNTPDNTTQSRREFLRNSSFALAGAAMAGSLGWASQASATERPSGAPSRLGVAVVGAGGRGRSLLRQCLRNREAWKLDFPAVCDVWQVSRDRTAEQIKAATGRRPRRFSRYQEMLEMDGIDAVIVATPDFSHTAVLVAAADAGKHVYVEKPMSVSIDQANAALDAALRNDTIVQAGTQFRSAAQFAEGARLVQSGELGRLLKIDCHYHRPQIRWGRRSVENVREEEIDWEQFLEGLPSRPFDPLRFRRWQLYRDYTVGLVGLLGTHVIDVANWFTGETAPLSAAGIEAWLTGQDSETADFQESLFTYGKGFVANCSCRTGNTAPGSQIVFYGTRGTLRCPFSGGARLVLSPEGASDDDPVEAKEIEPAPSEGHVENWIKCIHSGTTKTHADIHAGYAHSVASVLAVESAREGRRLHFDPSTREISAG